jgi:hypothetical protein
MVILVCFNCQNPVNIVSEPRNGIEIFSYHCPKCEQKSASFLLGYREGFEHEPGEPAQAGTDRIQRAKLFGQDNKHYKLRAKMQGLKALRANTEGRDPARSSTDQADPE